LVYVKNLVYIWYIVVGGLITTLSQIICYFTCKA